MEEKKTVKETVADRSEDQHHRLRTQSVITRRPPHPVRLTGALKQKLPVLIWFKGQQWMDALRIATSYFDKVWNAFAQKKDGSIQWIPEQIVGIGEDFHSQVDDGKVKTIVYRVRRAGMIERVIHGNRSHIYRDMLAW